VKYILENKILGYIVTPEGVIIDEFQEGDSYSVTRKHEKKPEKIIINKNENFIKVYYKKLFEVSKELNGTEVQFLNYLIGFIAFNTSILCHPNGKILTRKKMSEDTQLDLRRVDQILNVLVNNEVLHKSRTGKHIYFIANPFIFMKGVKINIMTVKLFENTKRANK